MLGRCHPLDSTTLQPEAVPENMTDQVCNAVQSSGTYDCGDGYLCLDGDYEAFYVSSTCLLADACEILCFLASTLSSFSLIPLCQWCHVLCTVIKRLQSCRLLECSDNEKCFHSQFIP